MSPYLDRSLGRLAASLGDPRGEGFSVWWYEGFDAYTLDLERKLNRAYPTRLSDWPGWY